MNESVVGPEPVVLDPMRISRRSRVAIGIADTGFHQEVLDWLGRTPGIEVIATAQDPESVLRHQARVSADELVVCPTVARGIRHPSAVGHLPPLSLVAQEMTVPVLREAIELGAQAVYAWPEERQELADSIRGAHERSSDTPDRRGKVVAVLGARGGAGATFLVTNLAAAFAARGASCVLVDMDQEFADVTVALRVEPKHDARTIADLVPVAEELSPEHVSDALFRHSRGFSVLLAPEPTSATTAIPAALYRASVALLACTFEFVLLHVPRRLDELGRLAITLADDVLLVTTLDMFALFGARRATVSLDLKRRGDHFKVVVNRNGYEERSIDEVEGVLGVPASAVIRFDREVPRVQERGELLRPTARRAGRDVRSILRLLTASQEASERKVPGGALT